VSIGDALIEKLTSTIVQEAEKTRLALTAGFADSMRGQRIVGALARQITPNAQNYTAGGQLVGWSVLATGAVRLIVHDGATAADPVIAIVDLVDGENDTTWLGHGVGFIDGLYIEQVGTGTAAGAFYIAGTGR
jgi:hypothetical protein